MNNSVYYDVQRLSKIWFMLSICFIDALLLYVLVNMFSGSYGFLLSLFITILLLAASALDIYLFLFLKLTVNIDYEFLDIKMIPFFSVTIQVDEIFLTEKTVYRPFRDYRGAGFGNLSKNNIPGYFLSGKTGVIIHYPLANKILVGASDPRKLIQAIQYSQQRKRILSEMD